MYAFCFIAVRRLAGAGYKHYQDAQKLGLGLWLYLRQDLEDELSLSKFFLYEE